MAENSKIEWTTHTFNPWRGCSQVSPGCDHCYAESMSKRNPAVLGEWGDDGTRVVAAYSYWRQPIRWNSEAGRSMLIGHSGQRVLNRPRVFCASLADVFEDRTELVEPRLRLFHLIDNTPNLDWLLLTKRPENIARMTPGIGDCPDGCSPLVRTNVWLGVSVEDQQRADQRIPQLLKTPAAVRFLSIEPLLGPVDLRQQFTDGSCDHRNYLTGQFIGMKVKCLNGHPDFKVRTDDARLPHIDWVIVGGESGHGARPMHPDWARSLRDQCAASGVPFFFKQWGEWLPISECHDAGTQFYKPNRVAKYGEDQSQLDDVYGRHCTVETRGVQFDGFTGWNGSTPYRIAYQTFKVGKHRAGRLLDNREWNEMPTVAATVTA